MSTPAPVVVAVGPTGADAAIEYAAREAVLLGTPVHVVHVLQVPASTAIAAGVYGDLAAEARSIVDKAVERARDLVDGRVPVTGEHIDGPGATAKKLAEGTGSELAQLLGRTALLFKKRDEDSKFEKL